MEGSQYNDNQSYDPTLGEFFDVETYYADNSTQLGAGPDAEPGASAGSVLPGRTTNIDLREDQEYSTDAAIASPGNQAAFTNTWFNSLGQPS